MYVRTKLPGPHKYTAYQRAVAFWTKVEFTDTCWLWNASKFATGYGGFWDGTAEVYTHRYAYEFCVGPIPEGLTLDHLCRVRACVRPDHLEPVTHRVNILRGTGASAQHARKTHCKRGHEFTPANTYRAPTRPNGRRCRVCSHNYNAASWAAKVARR